MYGDYVDPGEGPGNPYPYIAAAKAQELAAAQRELAELKEKAQYSYASEEALVCSDFFQNALKKSLAFKDREILALQNELLQFARATPSPPVAAPPATPVAHPNLGAAPQNGWDAWTHVAQPQPQPAQPLTGAPVRRMTLMRTGQSIPFTALNEEWAQNNHGQSLAKLQDRGGLAPGEALAIIERRKFRVMDAEEALHAVLRHVAGIPAPSTPTPPPGETP